VPVTVEIATEVTPDLVDAFARLIPQLSTSNPPPDADALGAVVGAEANTVFVARLDDGTVVGTLTLCVFPIPTATRAWIEDVVADSAHPGLRVGELLCRAAMERAVELGAKTVDLTSRPSREAANHIYRKLGFELRTTNVYRWTSEG
jgi:ribosomal protein S18 acetylase RimI-like enzyme